MYDQSSVFQELWLPFKANTCCYECSERKVFTQFFQKECLHCPCYQLGIFNNKAIKFSFLIISMQNYWICSFQSHRWTHDTTCIIVLSAACDKGCPGKLMASMDVLEGMIKNINISGLTPAPWRPLLAIKNRTEMLQEAVDNYTWAVTTVKVIADSGVVFSIESEFNVLLIEVDAQEFLEWH